MALFNCILSQIQSKDRKVLFSSGSILLMLLLAPLRHVESYKKITSSGAFSAATMCVVMERDVDKGLGDMPEPVSQLRVKTYTKTTFLGQAIKDDVFAPTDVLVTVSGLSNTRFEWSLGEYTGEKQAKRGILTFTQDDLKYTNAEDGDKLTVKMGVQERPIATYKPGQIRTWQDLQAIRQSLTATYTLINDIVFPDLDRNNIGDYNFIPVGSNETGTNATRFMGTLIGNGHTIYKLYINRGTMDYVGLFGYVGHSGRINSPSLKNVIVSGKNYVGGLAGYNGGLVKRAYMSGRVAGTGGFIGGLLGYNKGTTDGYTKGYVFGVEEVGGFAGGNGGSLKGRTNVDTRGRKTIGGLVGVNSGTVSGYAKGNVSGGKNTGGLVGENSTFVEGYARGNVIGGENVGGMVGMNEGQIYGYATGQVQGSDGGVGGLVGNNLSTGFVMGYTKGMVIGNANGVGGLVGINEGITVGYATGKLRGGYDIGGLVGYNRGDVIGYARGSVIGVSDVGGLVGTTFGSVVGYALGYVAGGAYVGGLVGSDFNAVQTVGYWNTAKATQSTVSSTETAIGIRDIKKLIITRDEEEFTEKPIQHKGTTLSAHPSFSQFFQPSSDPNGWPVLKKKIVLQGKTYHFKYPQLP